MGELAGELDEAASSSGFSGAVRVDAGGETLRVAYGYADRETGRRNTPETRIAVASGSKTFTALMIVRLIEQGVLGFATTARELLGDDLPLIADDVTVEHLLAHRSGIGDYLDEDVIEDFTQVFPPVPVEQLDVTEAFLPWLDGHPTAFPAGERFAYCNGGFMVLALVAERATGRPFHDLVDELVIRPAEMPHTAYLRSDQLPADAALGYLGPDDGPDRLATNVRNLPVRGNGDGGAYTTVDDVDRFWRALFAGQIVSPDSVSLMTRRHSDVDTDDDDDPIDRGYGLGFWDMPPGHPVLLGSDSGASFKSLHCPERALTFTVISNCTNQAWAITSVLNTRFGT
jgi:CubicO group peptidase (beta-lactamase class C family)